MNQSESISLGCTVGSNFSLQNQDFRVNWSKVENVLDWHLNSSQDRTANDLHFARNKELRDHHDLHMTLKHLHPSDSGEYLCNVSSPKYTFLTVHRVQVGKQQIGKANGFWVLQQRFVCLFFFQNVIGGDSHEGIARKGR